MSTPNAESVSHAHTSAHAAHAGELVLDRYRLVRRIGAGGMGVVYLARDEHLERDVAVKRIAIELDREARGEREALAAARLSHPGIVALYESGRDDDAVYLVSELVRGRTLADLIRDGELSDRDVVLIGMTLCEALEHAHARGVVHRDVKPSNVMCPDEDGAGVAKLTDFGIALMADGDVLTRTGDIMGTLAYMAPEQAAGRGATGASDVYALGVVLYEGLAGVNPIRADNPAATARRVGMRLPRAGARAPRPARGAVPRDRRRRRPGARAPGRPGRPAGRPRARRRSRRRRRRPDRDRGGRRADGADADRAHAVPARASLRARPTRRESRELAAGDGATRAASCGPNPFEDETPREPLRDRRAPSARRGARATRGATAPERARMGRRAARRRGRRRDVRASSWRAEDARAQRDRAPRPTATRRRRRAGARCAGRCAPPPRRAPPPSPPPRSRGSDRSRPPSAAAGSLATFAVVLLLPRLGWLAMVGALLAWLATAAPGLALLVAVAAAPVPLLLPRRGIAWSLPAAAPLLGAAGLAGAFPAIAGQARTWPARAALGAIGGLWLVLAEALTSERLLFGQPRDVLAAPAWDGSALDAVRDAVIPIQAGGTLAIAALWALAAALLPVLVRGRSAALDLVATAGWAAALAAATGALGEALMLDSPRGLVAGALVAGARRRRGASRARARVSAAVRRAGPRTAHALVAVATAPLSVA